MEIETKENTEQIILNIEDIAFIYDNNILTIEPTKKAYDFSTDFSHFKKFNEDDFDFVEENSSIILLKKMGFKLCDKPFEKYYNNPISLTSQFYFCPVPLRMDTYSGCSHRCVYCCLEGTNIALSNGKEKKIEEINKEDLIYSLNLKNQKKESSKVLKIYKRISKEIYEIELYSKKICITGEHPVFTKRGWIKVKNLNINDKIFYKQISTPEMREASRANMKKTWSNKSFRNFFVESSRKRMINNNPMKNKKTAKKMGITIRERYKSNHYNKGRKRPDMKKKFTENNPMKDFETAKRTLKKSRATFLKNGKISKGQKKLYEILDKMGILYKKEFFIGHPKNQTKGNYFLDVAILDKKINIEYDGHSRHKTEENKDKERDKLLKSKGWKILRLDRFCPFNEKRCVEEITRFLETKVHNPFRMFIRIYNIKKRRGNFNVYNLEVEPNNNYFANNILVHNCFANNSNTKFIGSKDYKTSDKEYLGVLPTKYSYVKEYFDIVFEGKKNTFREQEALAIECMKRRVPIHLGGMSDPFQPLEAQLGLSYRVLKLFKKYEYPVIISSKGKPLLDPRYFKLITSMKNVALQISLIDDRDEVISKLDPYAATASERFEIMKKYSDAGIWIGCRIQPFIIKLNEDRIKIFVEKLANAGVKHVMVEGLKLFSGNKDANKRIGEVFKILTGKSFDLAAYYKSIGSKTSGNDLELPSWRKYKYAKVFQEEIKKHNMTYGAADNDLRFLGDSPCCCGVEGLKGFENLIKHNTGFAVFEAMRKNNTDINSKITYNNIKDYWFPSGKFRVVMSNEKIAKKLKKDITEVSKEDTNIDILTLFKQAWNKGNKNSPCDQCIMKCTNIGEYCFKSKEILEEELKFRGEQKTL